MMSRSGQVYGLLGSVAIATSEHEGKVLSDDLIRIAGVAPLAPVGYVYVALTHPVLGRPRVKALAYGSSIPHIEPAELIAHGLPRLSDNEERIIADLAMSASEAWSAADHIEKQMADNANRIVSHFLGAHGSV